MAKEPPLTGTGGNVTIAGYVGMFQSWRAVIQIAELNTTGFLDDGWVDGKAINCRVVGDAVGIIGSTTSPIPVALINTKFDATAAAAAIGAVVLTMATGKTLSFNALVSATELERAEEGQNNSVCRFRFASVGVVSRAWA